MAVYIGHDECRVIYVARNGQQLRVSSVWVGDQQVFPPANRQQIHVFNRATQGYGRVDNGTHFGYTVPVPWWAVSMDVVLLGAGEKGRDGTRSITGGKDGDGGRSGAWVVRTVALPQSADAVVRVGKGTSTSPHATEMILPGVGGQSDVRVYDGEGTRTANSGSTGGSVTPRSRNEYDQTHTGGAGGSRNNPGGHPGGGGGGGQGSGLIGNPQTGRDGGDGHVWLRFRSAPGIELVIIRVGVTSGNAYTPLREWAVSIGKTHETITGITMPMEVIGPSLQSLFYDCQALVSVPDLDTSQVTNMQWMFYNCSSLASVPDLDTSQVTNMYVMFYGCSSLTTIPALDTGQVTNMQSIFNGCSSLTTVPDLNTSNVTNMERMFYGCSSLAAAPALDTGQVTTMYSMFYNCSSLTTIPALDTSNVTTMQYMLYGCSSLTTIPALDAGQVTDMDWMFYNCSSLESVTLPGMGNGFTTAQTLNMKATKLNAGAANALMQSLGTPAPGGALQLPATATGANTSIAASKNWTVTIGDDGGFIIRVGVSSGDAYGPLREWAVSSGKPYQTITEITVPMEVIGPSLQRLFYDFQALVSVPELDTGQVTNMRSMFDECSSLTTIPALDTSNVTDVYAMFKGCSSLATIPELDTSQVTNMRSMFYDCSSLTSVPDMDTSNVTDMYFMFRGCSSLTSVPALDTSQVTTMRTMFWGCSSLTSVPALDTSQVTSMRFMFKGCSSLTSVPDLNTSKATDVHEMFFGCSSLESVTLPGMGNGFTTGSSEADRTLDMRDTKLDAAAANSLMQSLGTPQPGGNLQLPSTAAGANTSIAEAKNWTVTIG